MFFCIRIEYYDEYKGNINHKKGNSMKKNINFKLLAWASTILLYTVIDARVNPRTGATSTRTSSQGAFQSGGAFTTSTSGGRRGATRTASSSMATGHSATTTGTHGTVSTTNTPTTEGTHTATTDSGTTKTVTNQQAAQHKAIQDVQQRQNEEQVRSLPGSVKLASRLASEKKESKSHDNPAKKRTLALAGHQSHSDVAAETSTEASMVAAAAMASQDASDSSSSQEPTTTSQSTSDNALFEAEANRLTGTPTVSSNASTSPSGAPLPPLPPLPPSNVPSQIGQSHEGSTPSVSGTLPASPFQTGSQMAQPPIPGAPVTQPTVA